MNTHYILDRENFILETGGDWDSFAEANGGHDAKSHRVLGRPVWDFVDGNEVTSFLNAVFFWCRRTDATFTTTYRCDSPTEARLFTLCVSPRDHGNLHVASELRSVRPAKLNLVPGIIDDIHEARCSGCCRYRIGTEWIDPFTQPGSRFVPTGHVVCPSCKNAARRAMGECSMLSVDSEATFSMA